MVPSSFLKHSVPQDLTFTNQMRPGVDRFIKFSPTRTASNASQDSLSLAFSSEGKEPLEPGLHQKE